MNKAYKYTLTANEHKEITFDVGVNRLAISNANGMDGDITIVTSEITKTDSGEICSFVDGADAPFADFKVNIEAVQSGSGDPSPTNVRPISGWTGANVQRTRENLFPYKDVESHTRNGVTFTVEKSNGVITNIHMQGTATADTSFSFSSSGESWTLPKGNFKLYIGGDKPTQNNTFDINIRKTGATSDIVAGAYETTISLSEWTTFGSAYIWIYSGSTVNNDIIPVIVRDEADTSIKYPITQRQSVNIHFGMTVYGGTLNVKTGELTVTHANIASYDGETINEPWISSIDKYVAGTTPTTGAQVVYPLTETVTYQLTPTEIRSLLGTNNVWADCGSIDIKYFVQSTQPLFDYINDEDDKCVYIDCEQTGLDTYSITSSITKAEFVSLLNNNKNVKLRLDMGSGDIIYDLSFITASHADFTYNRTALISDINSFQSMTLRVDMSGDTLSLSRHAIITIGDESYEYVTGQNNQLIKDGWSWSTQGYSLTDTDELLFMITPMPNVASDSNTIYGELQRSSQDPKRALFCKGIKNMLPEVQEIESPFWFNDIVVVGNRTTHTATNDIIMKIRVWTRYYNLSDPSLADVNFYADCDCSDSTANLWGMCNIFVFKKKR